MSSYAFYMYWILVFFLFSSLLKLDLFSQQFHNVFRFHFTEFPFYVEWIGTPIRINESAWDIDCVYYREIYRDRSFFFGLNFSLCSDIWWSYGCFMPKLNTFYLFLRFHFGFFFSILLPFVVCCYWWCCTHS